MPPKDYYDILGLSRNAGEPDIKRAYRKLVRKHHPDVSKAKNAAEKFKQVQEAYDVLSDPKKRAAYDQFGHAGVGAGPGVSQPWGHGPRTTTWSGPAGFGMGDFDAGDLFDQLFGGRSGPVTERSRGRVRPGPARGQDVEHNVTLTFEQAVWGTTMRIQLSQGGPHGNVKAETIDVKIPPGVTEGSRVRVRGKGDPGAGGGRSGDLYIVVHVKPHPHFRREGHDIYLDVPISVPEAIRGAKITIPTIDGPTVLTVPSGTSSGQRLRLREKGAPNPKKKGHRGDQYVVIKLVVPPKAPNSFDDTLDALGELTGDPRKNLGWPT